MEAEEAGRREFLRKIPLFGAGLALGLSALADAGEAPKARKLVGGDIEPEAICATGSCNTGFVTYTCNTGDTSKDPPTCNSGARYGSACAVGTCNVGS